MMMACVRIPHFAAAVERRENPALSTTPLIITESAQGPEQVFSVSEGAVRAGIEPGMSLRQAQVLCPQAHFTPAVHARYRQAFDELLEALESLSPRVEAAGSYPSATVYLDLTDQKSREVVEVAQSIGQAVRQEVHLAPAVGLDKGKFTTHVAAVSVEPNSALLIAPGRERAFLAPFPVKLLPLGEEMVRRLQLLGIRTLGQLAALPLSAVQTQLGKQGQLFQQLARGHDDRPLVPRRPSPTERVTRQLDGAVGDRIALEGSLRAMVMELTRRLRARGLAGQELRLILHLEDGTVHEERLVMRRPSGDQERLRRILTELLGNAQVRSGVIELELVLDNLVPVVGQQLDLFVHGTGQEHRLRDVLKDLVNRYGSHCFYQVSLLDHQAPLPELRCQFREMDEL